MTETIFFPPRNLVSVINVGWRQRENRPSTRRNALARRSYALLQ